MNIHCISVYVELTQQGLRKVNMNIHCISVYVKHLVKHCNFRTNLL